MQQMKEYMYVWMNVCTGIVTHADYLVSDIPCTRIMSEQMIRGDYETETGNQILQAFENPSCKI